MSSSDDLLGSDPPSRNVEEVDKFGIKNMSEVYEVLNVSRPRVKRLPFDKGLGYHPDGLLDTNHRRDMYAAFETRGPFGLAQFLYKYALGRSYQGDNFKHFQEDERATKPVLSFLISTMHPEVVKALICRNLSHRSHTDERFRQILLRTTEPWTTPGIYFNQMYDTGKITGDATQYTQEIPASESRRGRGLSYKDWKDIDADIRLYRNPSATGSLELAKKIDYAYVGQSGTTNIDFKATPDKRRYYQDSRKKVLDKFLETLEAKVLRNGAKLDPTEQAKQAQWSILEIGYGADTLDRLKVHIGNENTNWLWGLLVAIIRVRFGERFGILQGQLLYLCHVDHRNLGEALCSVLASSYHDDMGGNPKRAGGIGSSHPSLERGLRTNIQELLRQGGERYTAYSKALEHNRHARADWEERTEREENDPVKMQIVGAEEEQKQVVQRAEDGVRAYETERSAVIEHLQKKLQ